MILLRRRGLLTPPIASAAAEYARREALTIGEYKPTVGGTAGLLSDSSGFSTITGTTNLTGGQTLEGVIVDGLIVVTGTNNVIKNCLIRGPVAQPAMANSNALVKCSDSSQSGLLITDCVFDMQANNAGWDGVLGHHVTMKRCVFRHFTDSVAVFNLNDPTGPLGTQILGCYSEGLARFNPDLAHSDGTHNDFLEVQGGSGLVVRGCVADGYLAADQGNTNGIDRNGNEVANSAIQFASNVGAISDFLIENNWFYGGEFGINAGTNKISAGTSGTFGTVRNNKFDHGQTTGGLTGGNNTYTINLDSSCAITFSNNTYEDNGNAVTVRRT